MANRDERSLAAARVYGQSLLELAERSRVTQALGEELLDLGRLIDRDAELRTFFASPLIDAETRRAMIEKTFRGRASELLVDGLQVLNRHGRIGLLDIVVEAYRTGLQASQGHVDVHVQSAVALSDGQRQDLAAAVKAADGRVPDLIETVDPNMLGGLVVRIGDRKIDTSVAKDLKTVRAQLADRAAREILADRVA
jgi:F-type H+-transporting ATPase subunit delta